MAAVGVRSPTEVDRWCSRQTAVVGPTSQGCVRGVDLAVRRRIKWLIGVARRGEGVKRSAPLLPFSWSLSLSSSASRKGHWGWTNKSHGHQTLLTTAALGLHSDSVYWSLQCAYSHFQKTHACTQTHTHCRASPSTWQWFYKSPQCGVSYSPSSTRTTSAVQAQGKGGERRTIPLLNCSAVQEELSIKLIKNGRESRNWFVKGSWCQLLLKLWPI